MSSRTVSMSDHGREAIMGRLFMVAMVGQPSARCKALAVPAKSRVMITDRVSRSAAMRQKPTVLAREIVASSRLFRVEELQLRFSNGVERTYERLVGKGSGYGAVMILALEADRKSTLLNSSHVKISYSVF